ncbi:hypothetical protein KSS87_007864 [Heliosperma pusillum]|nr:hypothetical protein KSS87_007864 [Heliosperma pusillum]
MANVEDNWERLVRATQQRNTAAVNGDDRRPSSLASIVPSSLGDSSHIDAILQAADEIQDYDPTISRILCEQAYSMSQELDPSSDGRGVLQFKTGLMSIIKQKLSKRDGAQIDRSRDVERLWKFYQRYKQRHRVDDIRREEQKSLETGVFSTNVGELAERRKVFATLRALVEVMKALSNDASPEMRQLISEEVRGAISAIMYAENFPKLPASYKISGKRNADMFDLLEYVFGFQRDNVRNQRENVILAIANAQSRLSVPDERDPKIDEDAIDEVFSKVLDNYIKWCKYLRIRVAWNSSDAITRERKLLMISLYFLIWGEAANVRFLPECICYIFHNMGMELDPILNNREASFAGSCKTEHGSVSYLEQVIYPIYETQAALWIFVQIRFPCLCSNMGRYCNGRLLEASKNDNGKAAHSVWRNYDDFNEYFWSPACFKLGWPMKKDSAFLRKPRKWKRALTIIAFSGKFNMNTFKILLSVGPTFAVMNFVESEYSLFPISSISSPSQDPLFPTAVIFNIVILGSLDILLMFGAYTKARGMAISRLVLRFCWWFLYSVAVSYFYLRLLQDWNKHQTNSLSFRMYMLILGAYAGVRVLFALLFMIPACHAFSQMSDQAFFQFFKWIYQERYFVGRGLFEKPLDYARYALFWLVIFAFKFTFAYYLQIRPLVRPTKIIVNIKDVRYSWHSFVSKRNYNALTIASLWAPVVAIYIMDMHIWYTLLSALVGGVMGARQRLGEIRSIEMVHERFESFPEAFVKNLSSPRMKRMPINPENSQSTQETNKSYASMFAPFWNEIIKSLREEDYIGNREEQLLSMPSNAGTLPLVQWPLFLLSNKIVMAIDLALDCKDTQADLWNRICRDDYMAYAVQECYYSIEKILHAVLDDKGSRWVERVYREINNCIIEGSLHLTLSLKKLRLVQSRFTALTGLLTNNETSGKALYDFYDVVTHDLLSTDLREQIDTWNILAEARSTRVLGCKNDWQKDSEITELVKRLHLLLTVKDTPSNIPKNLEARRRLEFFTNSLFMDMPLAKPVCEMVPFCVFTPYYSETVLYSSKELREENEDGVSTLFYLQKIFPDEWVNFLERINKGESSGEVDFAENSIDNLELRFWVSYRGQTLARTVRGMMYYRRALMLQSFLERRGLIGNDEKPPTSPMSSHGFESSSEARAQADLKFTYIVSCQIYGQQKQNKTAEAADISLLLQRNEALRVAFIHVEESAVADGKVVNYYSKLVKADVHGKDQEIYSIKLPGDPKLGEGKPENQNHAIVFTRGDAIQTIDMNQDNYLEEALKMRNLLEEFHEKHGIRPPTILGVREHVFTGSVSSLAWFMSNQETSFVTLGQRVLAKPLK